VFARAGIAGRASRTQVPRCARDHKHSMKCPSSFRLQIPNLVIPPKRICFQPGFQPPHRAFHRSTLGHSTPASNPGAFWSSAVFCCCLSGTSFLAQAFSGRGRGNHLRNVWPHPHLVPPAHGGHSSDPAQSTIPPFSPEPLQDMVGSRRGAPSLTAAMSYRESRKNMVGSS